jgi:glycosyltransferase involved in cell wall biosynthesis
LGHCNGFITTSDFAKRLLSKNFPQLDDADFRVIPHGRDFASFDNLVSDPEADKPMRVLIPGNISVAKGAGLIKQINELDGGKYIEFHILGDHGRLADAPGLVTHGRYARDEFRERVANIRPAIGGVLSLWPETYCHTLTEMWSLGIPVVGLDIGAVGERINVHGGGWALPLEMSASEVYNELLRIKSNVAERSEKMSEVLSWQKGYGKDYDTNTMADQYRRIYADVIQGSKLLR